MPPPDSQESADQRLIADAREHFRLVLAAIDAAPAGRQIPMLREFFERRIDQMEQAELELYDFIAECATLAAQNMQDVRLATIEDRLDAIEGGASQTVSDFLIDLALMLAVEVAVVVAPTVIAGAATGLVSALAFGAHARATLKAQAFRDALRDKRAGMEQLLVMDRAFANLQEGRTRAGDLGLTDLDLGMFAPPSRLKYDEMVRKQEERLRPQIEALVGQERQADDLVAMVRSSEYADAVKDSVQQQFVDVRGKWKKMADYAGTSPVVQVTVGRVSENVATAFQEHVTDAGGSSSGAPPFTTTSALAEALRQLRQLRRQVRYEYSSFRTWIRYADDNILTEDPDLVDGMLAVLAAGNRADAVDVTRKTVQDSLIVGFEVPLWALWLKRIGALEIGTTQSDVMSGNTAYDLGDVFKGYLIEEARGGAINNVPQTWLEGRPYPGLSKLTPFLAHYLFERFAKYYLRERPGLVPFPYHEGALSHALSLPETTRWGWAANPTRERRINLMRACVIIALEDFLETRSQRTGFGLFGLSGVAVGDVFVVDPRLSPVPEEDVAGPEPTPAEKSLVRAMLEESGALDLERAHAALVNLEAVLRDTEILAELHAVTSGSITIERRVLAPEQALAILDENLHDIAGIRAQLEGFEDPDLGDLGRWVETEYGERIRRVDEYVQNAPSSILTPTQHAGHSWHFKDDPGSTP
ncbi:MAG: hypothetical protein R3E98_18785 [Gemmatimonadota bacterium]